MGQGAVHDGNRDKGDRSESEGVDIFSIPQHKMHQGRKPHNYQEADKQMKWIDFFDQEFVYDANDIAAKGNLVYITNNDEINHSILVFELGEDSVYTHPQRYKVGEYIWAIDIDDNGRIYVTKTGDSLNAGSVMIFENSDTDPAWTPGGTTGTILHEFQLPEVGEPRGLTLSAELSVTTRSS